MQERLSPKETLLSRKFDLIMVMGSPFDLDANGYHYPLFTPHNDDLNTNSNIDGDIKAQAIEQIYLSGMTPKVLVTGGLQNGISRAEALVKHTNEQYYVPLEFMIPLTSKPHSLGNLETTIKYLEENPELKIDNFGILTLSAHIKRAARMAQDLNLREILSNTTQFLSAEAVLLASRKLNIDQIKRLYGTDFMKLRIANEHQGIRDLIEGNYTPRS